MCAGGHLCQEESEAAAAAAEEHGRARRCARVAADPLRKGWVSVQLLPYFVLC